MHNRSLIGPWIRRFLLEYAISDRNLSQNTQHSYRDTLSQLLPFASLRRRQAVESLTIEALDADLVRGFLLHLEQHRGCSVRTRNQRLATIHSLAKFIGERSPEHLLWCSEIRNIPIKRSEKPSIPYLEKDEMEALMAAPSQHDVLGRRDYKLLLFLYNSGARASEAANVLIEDLNWDSTGTGSVKLNGKGRKVRLCPLWKKTMVELKPLTHNRAEHEPLFLNRFGRPFTRSGIHALVERYVKSVAQKMPSLKAKRVSPHTIRHTTATHLLRAGVDLNTIRSWLGHVSLETTNIYAETDLAIKAKALATCDPGIKKTRSRRKWRNDRDLMEFLRRL